LETVNYLKELLLKLNSYLELHQFFEAPLSNWPQKQGKPRLRLQPGRSLPAWLRSHQKAVITSLG